MDTQDTISIISSYGDNFYDFSTTCKVFRSSWGTRPRRTTAVTSHTTARMLHEYFDAGLNPSDTIIDKAAALGRLDLMLVASTRGCQLTCRTCKLAANNGHIEALDWSLHEASLSWSEEMLNVCVNISANAAANGGRIAILKYLVKRGCKPNEYMCYHAARGGHLNTLVFLQEIGCPWDYNTSNAAARNGHSEVVKWAIDKKCSTSKHIFVYAALGGHVDILRWLVETVRHHGPVGSHVCTAAAGNGHINVLEYCKELGIPWTNDTCRSAAASGNINALRWGLLNGQMVSREASVTAWASVSDCAESMDWLVENGFQYDYSLCKMAAKNGSFNVLEWAKTNGIRFDNETWCGGLMSNRQDVLEYLRKNRCPGSS